MAGDKEAQELEEWKLRAAEFHTRAEQAERERDELLVKWGQHWPIGAWMRERDRANDRAEAAESRVTAQAEELTEAKRRIALVLDACGRHMAITTDPTHHAFRQGYNKCLADHEELLLDPNLTGPDGPSLGEQLAAQAERIAALEAAIRECPPHDVECATNDSYGESCECWLGYLHTLAGKAGQS